MRLSAKALWLCHVYTSEGGRPFPLTAWDGAGGLGQLAAGGRPSSQRLGEEAPRLPQTLALSAFFAGRSADGFKISGLLVYEALDGLERVEGLAGETLSVPHLSRLQPNHHRANTLAV